MVKLTALIVFMTLLTVASSVAAVVMSWWQVKAAEQAQRQAEADGNEEKRRTRAALHIAAEQAKSTRAAVEVALLAAKSQIEQARTARSALLIDQTPHITVAGGQFSGSVTGQRMSAIIKLTNTGRNTLFNARTSAALLLSPLPKFPGSWNALPYRNQDTLGPTDAASYHVYHPPLTPEQFSQLRAKTLFVIVASRTTFRDEAGRHHVRYLCQFYGVLNNEFSADECSTPPQS